MNVTFYYDIVCPYAYLASTQLQRLVDKTGAQVEWTPVLLGGIFRNIGGQQSPMNAMSAPRAKLNLLDLQRFADRWGVPFRFPSGHPRRSVEAMRLLTALEGLRALRCRTDSIRPIGVRGWISPTERP